MLRASGVPYDVRRADPYSIYDELDFDVAVRYNGDIYDRYLIRMDEMRQSLRILEQVLPRLEDTAGKNTGRASGLITSACRPARTTVASKTRRANWASTSSRPASQNPYRYHIRAPSFINLTALEEMCEGHKVADVIAILGSIDIVLGEMDR